MSEEEKELKKIKRRRKKGGLTYSLKINWNYCPVILCWGELEDVFE